MNHPKGRNSTQMRRINERLVLRSLLVNGELSKAEIARLTTLTPPAVSAIVDSLVRGGYVMRGSTRRGSVGSPSMLHRLDPSGAYGLGLHVGRRGMEAVLIDLKGEVLGGYSQSYPVPVFKEVCEASVRSLKRLIAKIPSEQHQRISGIGLGVPHVFGFWGKELGYPPGVDDDWGDRSFTRFIESSFPFPVVEENDAAAATLAELEFGADQRRRDFLYVYIGTYIGGGLVLNGSLVRGPQRLTTTFGPYPVSLSGLASVVPSNKKYEYLFRRASLYCLINHLNHSGASVADVRDLEDLDAEWEPTWLEWVEDAGDAIAQAVVGATNVIDVPDVVIDSSMPGTMLARVVEAVASKVMNHSIETIVVPRISQGTMGPRARAIGSAIPPMYEVVWKGSKQLGAADPALVD